MNKFITIAIVLITSVSTFAHGLNPCYSRTKRFAKMPHHCAPASNAFLEGFVGGVIGGLTAGALYQVTTTTRTYLKSTPEPYVAPVIGVTEVRTTIPVKVIDPSPNPMPPPKITVIDDNPPTPTIVWIPGRYELQLISGQYVQVWIPGYYQIVY